MAVAVSAPRGVEVSASPQPRAAIYTRVSTQEQGERGYSLDAQARDTRKLAAEIAADVVAEYRDTDTGASWDLPGLNAMLDAAKRREFDLLLCYDPDRLARRMSKQLILEEELQRSGIAIRYVTLKLGDTAEDRLLKNMRSSFAEYEREKIALRTSRGKRAKAERGLVVGEGKAPYGYRYVRRRVGERSVPVGLEADPTTAPVVRRIVAELPTVSLWELCERLTAERVPSPSGGDHWVRTTIIYMVRNPVYVGEYYHARAAVTRQNGKKLVRWRELPEGGFIAVPALVTRGQMEAAREAMAWRRRSHGQRRGAPDDPFLLRGLLTCAHCGGLLGCRVSGNKTTRGYVRYYTCFRREAGRAHQQRAETCSLEPVRAADLEAHLWETVSRTLLDVEYLRVGLQQAREADRAAARRQEQIAIARSEIEKRRKRLERATVERLDAEPGSETERALRATAEQTEREITKLQAGLAELEQQPPAGLSDDDAEALLQFAGQIAGGIDAADPADRGRIYQLLRLRGEIGNDPAGGIKLGRSHRFSAEWRAALELRTNGHDLVDALAGEELSLREAEAGGRRPRLATNLDAPPVGQFAARAGADLERGAQRSRRFGRDELLDPQDEEAAGRAAAGRVGDGAAQRDHLAAEGGQRAFCETGQCEARTPHAEQRHHERQTHETEPGAARGGPRPGDRQADRDQEPAGGNAPAVRQAEAHPGQPGQTGDDQDHGRPPARRAVQSGLAGSSSHCDPFAPCRHCPPKGKVRYGEGCYAKAEREGHDPGL